MIRAILVRTEGARNAGLAARAVANFGPAELVFVAPMDPAMFSSCDFYAMAHGVADRRTRFPVFATLDLALAGATDTFGFTARMRRHRAMAEFGAVAPEISRLASDRERVVALVFGNEQDGLTRDESARLRMLIHIKTAKEQPSINLGAAVSIVLARIYGGEAAKPASKKYRPLPVEKTERLVGHLKPALLSLVRGDATRANLERSIERVFASAQLETSDARSWHRLARAVLGQSRVSRKNPG